MISEPNFITFFYFGLLRLAHCDIEDTVLCIIKIQLYFVFKARLSLHSYLPPPPALGVGVTGPHPSWPGWDSNVALLTPPALLPQQGLTMALA